MEQASNILYIGINQYTNCQILTTTSCKLKTVSIFGAKPYTYRL